MSRLTDFLGGTELFKGMSGLELKAVAELLKRRECPRGTVVFREGERGQELFIVLSGKVGSFVTQSDGTRRRIYEFGPGRFFGEMAIVEGEPRSATCWAEEDTTLLVLEGIDFYRLVFDYPMIGLKLLSSIVRVMVSWLNESSRFLNDLVRWGETARRRAVEDALTGLFNRRFLEETLANRFTSGLGSGRRLALVMLDLDHFREINGSFGPAAGDATIRAAGAAFRQALRDGDVAARLSGDEFAFLLPNTGLDEALAVAERLRKRAETVRLDFRPPAGGPASKVRITASLGVAVAPDHADTPGALIDRSDRALYLAKEGGRNRVAGPKA
ncbi:MAG TPA: GGDEF domain-containing protein [Spirochaetia bacterium]|nr:GGDEF domain-containing protein [Spirochaetales bacterium]HRY80340.1 GGDEF domain-containing protein [Spirochaetia bacterium]